MSDYGDEERKRGQSLLVVEGYHEKNELFWLIFKCFPEIHIKMDEIWIYGTNIYQLYDDIVKEYGKEWAEKNDDIDLPFVISKKQHPERICYKEDFTNIILVFDYERHDTNFSEEKILEMQRCFIDAADMGKLYINYPMIESYQHLCKLPDGGYADRKIPVSLQPGKKYKALVEKETIFGKFIDFPRKVDDLLRERFDVDDLRRREECCDKILKISGVNHIEDTILNALQGVVKGKSILTAKYQLIDWATKQRYPHMNQTYWQYMRGVLQQVIQHNICKASRIQYGEYQIPIDKYREYFEKLDFTEILKIQNLISDNETEGFIWVLNTCVFFIAEYNFRLVMEK